MTFIFGWRLTGFSILLEPGGEQHKENDVVPEVGYDNENDLRREYDV